MQDHVFVDSNKFGLSLTILIHQLTGTSCLQSFMHVTLSLGFSRLMTPQLGNFIRQTDCLLEPAMKNVMSSWSDKSMPHIELSKLKLTNANKSS